MPCTVRVGEERFSGLVLNLSTGGVFVQTRAEPRRGHDVGLELQAPGESAGIPLSGTVAWRKIVPGQLRPVAGGGFGVRIRQADARYYDALARWRGIDPGLASDGFAADPSGPEQPAWRVRVRATASPRSRTVTVEAADEADARDKALAHVGARWTVIEVDAL
jgi:Tfp pilus assembly protein PilZ